MTPAAAQPRKGGVVVLDRSDTVGEAFTTIAHSCLDHLAHNEAVYLQTGDIEALHQLRVAARRLRSAFSLFSEVFRQDPVAEDLRTRLREIAQPFGAARDLDVFIEDNFPQGTATPGAPLVAYDRLLDLQEQAHGVVTDVLGTPEWLAVRLGLGVWLDEIEAPGSADLAARLAYPATGLAARSLDRFRRRVKRDGRHLVRLEPAQRHQVRIHAKKLRYASEFFVRLFVDADHAKAVKHHRLFLSTIVELQDALGGLNDLATSEHIWLSVGEPAPPKRAAREAELLKRANKAWHRLVKLAPFWR